MSDILRLKSTIFTFPSLGIPYEGLDLINGDSVEIRPLVAGDQRYLANAGSDPYKIYQSLLSRVIVAPKFNVDSILLADVNALLYAVRIMSFGPEYEISFTCENCGNPQKAEMSLEKDMMIKYADETPDWSATNLKLELPRSKKILTCHLLTLGDERAISTTLASWQRTGRSKNPQVDRIYLRLAQLIDTIDGAEALITDKYTAIDNMPIPDVEAIGELINKEDVGIVPEQLADCSACSYQNEVVLSITPDFFRSSTRVS